MAIPGSDVKEASRVGPGKLYVAPIGSTLPTDLTTALDAAWVGIGYTEEGSEVEYSPTFEQRRVAEELLPLATYQTESAMNVRFAMSQISAGNLTIAFNGGTTTTALGVDKWEPPSTGSFTPRMLLWEADDNLERWVWKKVTQVGAVNIPRRKAPAAANIPLDFEVGVPDDGTAPLVVFIDADLTAGA